MIKKNLNWNRVAVVLVNYNGKDLLTKCIDSLICKTEEDIEIVIVDNGSWDGSMDDIENCYPYIHTIYMGKNMGWGAGCNTGMKVSFENGARYALLLNTDTEIEKGLISELVKYCDDNMITIPRIYKDKEDKENSLWYSGGEIDFETACVNQTLFKYDLGDTSRDLPRKVEFATGCCMMISKVVWEKAGGFDEEYFLYYEDADYCMRLKEQGIEIMYVPKASLWHQVGGTVGEEISDVSLYYTVRNRLFFADKYKRYMKTDGIEILKKILEARAYFTTSFNKKCKKAVLAGIRAYLQGTRGKAEDFIHDNYAIISGFDDTEIDANGMHWLWNKEIEAEIEVRNFNRERKLCEVSGEICLPKDGDEKRIDVYWDGEYYGTIHSLLKCFCIQGNVEAGKSGRIKFVTEGEQGREDENSLFSEFIFCIRNMKVRMMEFGGYILGSGAYKTEYNENAIWNWIGEQNFQICLINEEDRKREASLSFNLIPAPTRDDVNVTLTEDGGDAEKVIKNGHNQLFFQLEPHEKKRFWLHANQEPVTNFNRDVRRFFYGIRDIRFEIL